MVTTERETSTLDEYQLEHRGYYYFPFLDDPQISTQSSCVLWPSAIAGNYLYWVNRDTKNVTLLFTPGVYGKSESFLSDESVDEQIKLLADSFLTINNRMKADFYHDIFNSFSAYIPAISDDLQIEQGVLNIFDTYKHEEFDNDVAYEYTNELERLIQDNDKPVIRIINSLINKHIYSDNIISETLKALGRIEDEYTKYERYDVLMGAIRNQSAIIRDGAVSGLSFLDDKKALPQLRMLFETETIPILKSNIKVAIRSLETY